MLAIKKNSTRLIRLTRQGLEPDKDFPLMEVFDPRILGYGKMLLSRNRVLTSVNSQDICSIRIFNFPYPDNGREEILSLGRFRDERHSDHTE
ncbi:hypothetical protein NY78_2881 [Desulfovibrio sp. TomC]|nr:hypothetical protein NY78_2881 [Desulfovibrio sp. TomC]